MNEPRVFILSAPSGAGKTSLAKALVEGLPDTALSISHTTREQRPGEVDGRDYFFVDRREFKRLIHANCFLEYAEVFGNLYGTLYDAVSHRLETGCNVILDIDWQGARKVRDRVSDALSIFVLPPSLEELERRLRARGQDSNDVIARRMRQAVDEMRHYEEYDVLVRNDDFRAALEDLRQIVRGHPEQVRPMDMDIKTLLDEPASVCVHNNHG